MNPTTSSPANRVPPLDKIKALSSVKWGRLWSRDDHRYHAETLEAFRERDDAIGRLARDLEALDPASEEYEAITYEIWLRSYFWSPNDARRSEVRLDRVAPESYDLALRWQFRGDGWGVWGRDLLARIRARKAIVDPTTPAPSRLARMIEDCARSDEQEAAQRAARAPFPPASRLA